MSTTSRAPEPAGGAASRAAPPPRGPFAMQMGPPQKSKNFKVSARRLIGLLAPDRAAVYALIALGVAGAALTVAGPAIMRTVTNLIYGGWWSLKFPAGMTRDQAIESLRASGHDGQADLVSHLDYFKPGAGIDFATLAHVLLLVLAMYMAASLFTWLQLFVLNQVVQRRVRALRETVQAKMNRLPLAYFDQQPRGELLSRVTNDIDNLATSMQQTMSQMLNAALSAIGVLVMMVVLSRLLAVIALITVPLSVFATARIGKRSQGRFAAQWKHVGALNAQVEEAFSGHALVNVFGRRKQVEATFAAKNQELYEMSFKAQFISSTIMPAINFIANLNYVAVAVVGGLRMASGALDLGGVQQFMQYSRMFSQNLSQLAQVSNVLQSGVASAERVFEVLDAPEQSAEPAAPARAAESTVRGEVRFDHVGFSYKPEQPLITDLSLVATPGQTVAIVGPTGAGKTTLVNLIMRFYELNAGAITIDGVDIAKMTRPELRSEIGMVLQDTWLFGGTIRDNIRYGNPSASEDDLQAAAKATYVDRFVRALPLGYDTVLDEAGSNISAGEKQLITIARAFLADPTILILDEATSSVDTRTEVLVQRAMAALRASRTSFVIAHRLSTIRNADLILVMDSGKIVEQGNHAELLAARGHYHDLYHAQFAAAVAA